MIKGSITDNNNTDKYAINDAKMPLTLWAIKTKKANSISKKLFEINLEGKMYGAI